MLKQLDRVRSVLDQHPRGIASDVDGTISEIAPSPEAALVSATMKGHLCSLTKRFDLVAAISGRSVKDARRLVGVDGLVYFGNHGLEWWADGRSHIPRGVELYTYIVRSALDQMRGRLDAVGAVIENKGATAAIHYRQSRDAQSAREDILEAIRTSPLAAPLRVVEGKMVIELRPPLPLHKGIALASLVHRYGLRSLIYLGDDTTDVDAFSELRKLRADGRIEGLSIAVVGPETPAEVVEHADATLQGVRGVETFLRWLTGDE